MGIMKDNKLHGISNLDNNYFDSFVIQGIQMYAYNVVDMLFKRIVLR